MLGLHSCTLCSSAMLMFAIEKAIYMVWSLSKCNPVCSALIAAIYVSPYVKSVNANNTCSGANLYPSPAPRCFCFKLKWFGVFLTGSTLRCTLWSCVPLQCCWCYSELTAILYVCPCVLCSVPLLLVLYLMCNIWDRTLDVSCIIVQPNVHPHQVFQSSLSFWNLIKEMPLSALEWSAGMYVMQLLSCTLEK